MADLSERLQAALAHRYSLERTLGHGGMATVYLAQDRKEHRRVALKVLTPELALAVRTERFLREIQIAAQLTHPGILPLHESGEVDGFLYYVMPYVEGPSLKERLERTGPLPVEEALRIAREVADALAYAHRRGIVHRDIKPGNILLVEGHAVVADFGIARAISAAEDAAITATGASLGTPAYMSPEQTSGAAVDERTDIYSLGCVLYEMLEGRPPFGGTTAHAVRASHLVDPIPPLQHPDVPQGIAEAVARALAKDPAGRFASVADFAGALTGRGGSGALRQTIRVAAVIAAVGLGVVLASRGPPSTLATEPALQSLAVLRPKNMSGDSTNNYLSEGIAEEVISLLGSITGLRVSGRETSFMAGDNETDFRSIGRVLGVDHLLESSVRSEGDSVRFTARLVRAADGYTRWSGTYNRERRGLLSLQQDIAWAIVQALKPRLEGGETSLVRRYTEDTAAYDLYLRGRYYWNRRSRESMIKAIDYFRLAVQEDSGYAIAYSGLADAYVLAGQYDYLPKGEAYRQAKRAALRAVSLDESLAEAHTSLARVYGNSDWDWGSAEREYRRAIALNPRYALARTWYGMMLSRALGRHDEAIREVMAGYELDPLSAWANSNVVVVLNHARRHDEAIRYARRAVELAPDWATAHGQVAQTYRFMGMYPEALAEYAIGARLGGRSRDRNIGAVIFARTGRRAEALEALKDLEERSRRETVWVELAVLYGALGDIDRAFQALDSAVTKRAWPGEPTLASNPDWDPLRSDPRFAALLRRIGVPP